MKNMHVNRAQIQLQLQPHSTTAKAVDTIFSAFPTTSKTGRISHNIFSTKTCTPVNPINQLTTNRKSEFHKTTVKWTRCKSLLKINGKLPAFHADIKIKKIRYINIYIYIYNLHLKYSTSRIAKLNKKT